MTHGRPLRTTCALLAAVIAALLLGSCHVPHKEAVREGLDVPLEGVVYNVYMTRQLNLRDAEDRGYAKLPEPAPGSTYYGVFLQACNRDDEEHLAAATMRVVDSQENEYEPVHLPEDNIFAYHPRKLLPQECIPQVGSLADTAPTSGALVVFELPPDAVENRPLELEIVSGYDLKAREPHSELVELDI